MLKSYDGRTKLCNCVSALLMLCLLILQFTPFWNCFDESVSISGLIWLGNGYEETTGLFSSVLGENYSENSLYVFALFTLIILCVGIAICVFKRKSPYSGIIAALCGIYGICGCIFVPSFRINSYWIVHLILYICLVASSAYHLINKEPA